MIDAYLRGLTARAAEGEPLDAIASVASFFLSRIDTKVDAQLPGGLAAARSRRDRQRARRLPALPGQVRRTASGSASQALGARTQRPLWASTGTKNPAYSDVLYVAELIGPDVINTMPEQTLRAFADHGEVVRTLDADPAGGRADSRRSRARRDRSRRSHRRARARGRAVVLRLLPPAARLHRGQARCRSRRPAAPAARDSDVDPDVSSPDPGRARVLIAGGGSRASKRCWRCARWPPICLDITILAPELKFINLSMSVDQPFKPQRVRGVRLEDTAAELGARWHHAALDRVEPERTA